MSGMVFDIQKFSVSDGPGIRTTVFLKGCPARCMWCHNPESICGRPELMYYSNLCSGCGSCARACPRGAHAVAESGHQLDRARCEACGLCAAACPSGALRLTGREMTAREVMDAVMEDVDFYEESGGGMTLSGGEPVIQRNFCIELLKMANEAGVHSAIETSGNYPAEMLVGILERADYILFDLKAMSGEIYEGYIGGCPDNVYDSLRAVDESGTSYVVRTPVVGGVNDSVDEIRAIAVHLSRLKNLSGYQLIRYHPLGLPKYAALGQDAPGGFYQPEEGALDALEREAQRWVDVLPRE